VEVGGAELARSTSATLVVTDGIPPNVAPPKYRLYHPTTLGNTTLPVMVHWFATDSSGVVSYQVQRQENGAWWSVVSLPTPTTTAVYPWLSTSYTQRYKVVATDGQGNSSAWVYGSTMQPLLTQETGAAVTYGGAWTSVGATDASGGSLRYATAAGASAAFSVTGSSVAWASYLGPDRGSANVYVDGVFQSTVSLYSAAYAPKRIVYSYTWGANGAHTITIVVVGTTGHPRVDVDAFGQILLL